MGPLTLPDTLIRIISAVTLIVLSNGLKQKHICSDQGKVGKENEALAHYSRMHHFLDEGVVLDGPESDTKNSPHCPAQKYNTQGKQELRIAVFADASKAFERVDPFWIIMILAAWGVSPWLIWIVSFLPTGRISRFRINGKWGAPSA
eukprot:1379062-Heterocapsa_arctica.AAC.1